MKRRIVFALLGFAFLAACEPQNPAQVVYRGNEYYGHEHWGALDTPDHQTYPPESPKYKDTYTHDVTPAPAPQVQVASLPPPSYGRGTVSSAPLYTPPPSSFGTGTVDSSQRFIWPVSGGKVILPFGPRPDGKMNDGINIAAPEGTPIHAANAGTVVYVGNELAGYGNMVILRHDSGWMTAYAHAEDIIVKKGDRVNQGDVIGHVGTTGGVKTPQLHFALREGKTAVDPELHLSRLP